jgi:hypothetical protein
LYSYEFKLSAKPFHDSISLVRRLSSFGNKLIVFFFLLIFYRSLKEVELQKERRGIILYSIGKYFLFMLF